MRHGADTTLYPPVWGLFTRNQPPPALKAALFSVAQPVLGAAEKNDVRFPPPRDGFILYQDFAFGKAYHPVHAALKSLFPVNRKLSLWGFFSPKVTDTSSPKD